MGAQLCRDTTSGGYGIHSMRNVWLTQYPKLRDFLVCQRAWKELMHNLSKQIYQYGGCHEDRIMIKQIFDRLFQEEDRFSVEENLNAVNDTKTLV